MALNAVTSELLIAANKADEAGGQLSQMMSALMDNLAPLQSQFVGGAGASFQTIKENIRTDLIAITDALNDVAEGVRTAGKDFDAADSEAQSEVTKAAEDAGSIINKLRGGA
ncbi:MAG: WXG100 family type VII secretion target [Micromonosporaceae bacterium]|nr:WXG100 family type VII secretion target [Micromonosporaceae bacterium]